MVNFYISSWGFRRQLAGAALALSRPPIGSGPKEGMMALRQTLQRTQSDDPFAKTVPFEGHALAQFIRDGAEEAAVRCENDSQ